MRLCCWNLSEHFQSRSFELYDYGWKMNNHEWRFIIRICENEQETMYFRNKEYNTKMPEQWKVGNNDRL